MLLFQVGAQWHDKQKDAIFQESKLEMIKEYGREIAFAPVSENFSGDMH